MRHSYRGQGIFRLRTLLQQSKPLFSESEGALYSAANLSQSAITSLVYETGITRVS